MKRTFLSLGLALTVGMSTAAPNAMAVDLVGRAVLPAATFSPGPTSGQFITTANGQPVPFVNAQPVQGFSGVLFGPKFGTFLVMVDNGFGAKTNSADALLRFYSVKADFLTRFGGSGQVLPVALNTGKILGTFSAESTVQLNDQGSKSGFSIIAEQTTYYPSSTIPVDSAIKSNRWLTGADFDLESLRKANDGSYWFGEEFGPFLLHVSPSGQLLDPPFSLPNFLGLGTLPLVQSPSNPFLGTNTPNLPNSRGFEGMAITPDGSKLYAMLEGPLTTDTNRNRLLINEFDIGTKAFTGRVFYYRMENTFESGQAIGDLTAINSHEFLVIERDNFQGDPNDPAVANPARFKKVYKIDLDQLDSQGFVQKELVADLLNINDPDGLGGNGTTNGVFTFPFVTIEDVLPIDRETILVINDNNYPFSSGRTPGQADNNEFVLIKLDKPLQLDPRLRKR